MNLCYRVNKSEVNVSMKIHLYSGHEFTDVDRCYQRQYFEVLDVLQVALAMRFTDNPATAVLHYVEELLLQAANGECNQDVNELDQINKYGEIKVCLYVTYFHIMFIYLFTIFIHISLMDVQIKLFFNFLKVAAEKHMPGFKRITKQYTITTLIGFGDIKIL